MSISRQDMNDRLFSIRMQNDFNDCDTALDCRTDACG